MSSSESLASTTSIRLRSGDKAREPQTGLALVLDRGIVGRGVVVFVEKLMLYLGGRRAKMSYERYDLIFQT